MTSESSSSKKQLSTTTTTEDVVTTSGRDTGAPTISESTAVATSPLQGETTPGSTMTSPEQPSPSTSSALESVISTTTMPNLRMHIDS